LVEDITMLDGGEGFGFEEGDIEIEAEGSNDGKKGMSQRTTRYSARRTSCCADLGWKLAKILYAMLSKKATQIGGRSPKIFMSVGYILLLGG
jgi:hypothetical protein